MKIPFARVQTAVKKLSVFSFCVFALIVSGCKKHKDENLTTTSSSADTSMVFIKADHPEIQYTGRIEYTNPLAPSFSFPGVSIKAKFSGTAVDVVIKDYATGAAATTNYFTIVIDGNVYKVLKVNSTDTLYTAARGLSDAEHTIELVKRTESIVGKSSFKGFRILTTASLLSLGASSSRKMEFIGDSFTCGYGNDISYAAGMNSGFHSVNENNYIAWGAILGRELNARNVCTAYSGRGMYRNSTGSTIGTVPSFYDKIHPDAPSPLWNTANYVPDVIVIHLGTNDFAPEQLATPNMVDSTQFVNTYISLVNTLRSNYASAYIICVRPNSLTDYYPANFKSLTRITNFHHAVVDHFTGTGDTKVKYFELTPQVAPYGEDWHPSATTHASMAAQIKPFLQSTMGW